MKIEKVKTGTLKLNPANPRVIKDEKFAQLVRSIRDFPQMLEIRPIVVNSKMEVLGGNMRLRACLEVGLKEIPIIRAESLTDDQQREFIIKDNVGFGEWDWSALANEWDAEELADWGLDVPDFAGGGAGEAQEDDYEMPDEIKTDIVTGDLFEIGQHRLLCGDSTVEADVARLMDGANAILMVTDPPYGVSYTGKTKDSLEIKNDSLTEEQTHHLWNSALRLALLNMVDGGGIYATVPAGLLQVGFMQAMRDSDCLRQCMVWDKGQMVLGHSDYHYEHEPILYGWKPGAAHYFTGDRTKTTVFRYPKPLRNAEHPTMKPVELWAEMIGNSSKATQTVYDPFLGSGTTMVAAHQLNRKCYGMEIDPKYCQVIIDRMMKLDPDLEIKKNGQPYKAQNP